VVGTNKRIHSFPGWQEKISTQGGAGTCVIDMPMEDIEPYLESKLNLKEGLLKDEKLIQYLQDLL